MVGLVRPGGRPASLLIIGKLLGHKNAASTQRYAHLGEDAPIHAAMRADAMLEAGDWDGLAVWKRILRAVKELQGAVPGAGVQVH